MGFSTSFFLSFTGFILLNGMAVLNSLAFSAWLMNFKVKQWSKFTLAVFLLFVLQILTSQIILGIAGVLNYKNLWWIHGSIFVFNLLFFYKEIFHKTIFPKIQPLKLSLVFLFIAPFVGLFFFHYFIALLHPPLDYDSLAYHLPIAVEWLKTGSLMKLYYNAFAGPLAYYPSNFELLELWTFWPFKTDLFINYINFFIFPFFILGSLMVLKNFKLDKVSRWTTVLFLVSMPIFSDFFGFGHVDLFFTTVFILAIFFLQEFIKTKTLADLILFSVSLGLFLGTKYLGLPYAVPLIILGGAAIFFPVHKKPKRWPLKGLFILLFFSILGGGFWYIRNWIDAGNPLFPTEIKMGSHLIFEGYHGLTERIFKDSLAYNIQNFSQLKTFFEEFYLKVGLQSYFILLTLGCSVIFLIFSGLRKILSPFFNLKIKQNKQDFFNIFILLICSLFYFYFYWKSPYSYGNLIDNVRYALMFLVTSSFLTGFLLSRLKDLRFLALFITAGAAFYNIFFLILNPPKIEALWLREASQNLGSTLLKFNINYFLGYLIWILLLLLSIYLLAKTLKEKTFSSTILFSFFLGINLLFSASIFYSSQEKRENLKGIFYEDYYSAERAETLSILRASAWLDQHAEHSNIAYSGFNFHYPLFGRQLQRTVEYININECLKCRYKDYKKSPDSIRRDPNFEEWWDHLKARKIEYLIVTPFVTPSVKSWEFEWPQKHPEKFKLVYHAHETYLYQII